MTNQTQSIAGFAEFSRKAAAEGAVLLKNDFHTLPLKTGEHISIFGRSQIDFYRSGTGSGGSVNVAYSIDLLEGLINKQSISVNEELADTYKTWINHHPFDNGGGGWAQEPWFQKEMPLTKAIVEQASRKSSKAIIVLGRTAGEDKDNQDEPGSYQLTKDERQMLTLVTESFDQVIVVLNVSNIIDMAWLTEAPFADAIQSVLYVWQGGMEGGNAAADILVGNVTPSGKLTDTIAYSLEDYPSTENYGDAIKNYYVEDIYVGYRYFETFCPDKVQYEFGFGLSYTDFSLETTRATVYHQAGEAYLEVSVKVSNTGQTFAGKEVVQLYAEAPQGLLGKPKRSLIGFEKTNQLEPGESEEVQIHVPLSRLASYDDAGLTGHRSSYVLEAGHYHIFVGTSVKALDRVAIDHQPALVIDQLEVIETLEEALAPVEYFKRMKPGDLTADGSYQLTYEAVPQRQISLASRIDANLPKEIEQTGNKGYTLQDVNDKKVSMQTFIAQLNDEQLATIVRGEGMSSPLVTPGTASAFGGVSDDLFNYGIPIACTADGPSGLRMESGAYSTQVPIGTLLAATWNTALVEELYTFEGQEMLVNQVDILLGPGMNIRRSPLNGRNFEYFSEDPLITGAFATAVTRGIKKSGTEATLKHFACNNQEKDRHNVDAVVSERAVRELYLKGFEMAVKEASAQSIMTAYNPLNGHWTASNYDLATTILRNEWGFNGIVMTDWWAKMNDVAEGGEAKSEYTDQMVRSQNDLYMVVNNYGAEINSGNDNTLSSLEKGTLTRGELQRAATNICTVLMALPVFLRKQELNETAVMIEPKATSVYSDSYLLREATQVLTKRSTVTSLEVKTPGTYRIIVKLMSPKSNLAQTACQLMLNDHYVTTIQTNGTDGNWIRQKLVKVSLKPGFYLMKLADIKTDLEIEWIEFKAIE
ncbi:beta-glucosidase [Streptohalobacillus salinus]|uniref:Beta-glucosidase n=1 Tax=Streptohalobacillus salinus TaxID=621096 RepID=A0A2V3WBP3_9BACI|nr:glycoside hydrolase family 3 protein [Streptohalobacillus salinus]PXW90956.1 beta-glucosidase [Streptohalobacillus salinus]